MKFATLPGMSLGTFGEPSSDERFAIESSGVQSRYYGLRGVTKPLAKSFKHKAINLMALLRGSFPLGPQVEKQRT